jgi:uncharacterized protein YjbI with pentapeptide repeats
LEGSCFKEARFGHARLRGAQVQRCCFQQALLSKGRCGCWQQLETSAVG